MALSRRDALRLGAGLLAIRPARRARAGGSGRAGAAATTGAETAVPDGYAPLGSVPVEGLREAVVGPDGRYAFCAATTGFAVVDLSDPTAPEVVLERREILDDRESGPLRGIQDLKVDGDRLVVAGPAHPTAGTVRAVVLYDVSDPIAPRRRRVLETDHYHHNVFLDGDRIYLTGNDGAGNPVVILDDDLRELGRWSLADADEAWLDVPPPVKVLHDLWVQDGTAYLAYWDAGTWLVDVSDPAAPTAVATVRGRSAETLAELSTAEVVDESVQLPGNDHYVTVDERTDLMGVGSEAWDRTPGDDADGGPGGIELFDVSDPAAPSSLATVAPPPTDDPSFGGTWTTAHNFELAGDRLYASWYRGGVRVFDVADPGTPRLLRAWRDGASASFWTARVVRRGDLLVAASRRDPGDAAAGGRLYTFPDAPPGASGEPARPVTPPSTATTTTATTTTTTTTTATSTTRTTGSGFGVLGTVGAVGAVGLAAWRALRRGAGTADGTDGEDDDPDRTRG